MLACSSVGFYHFELPVWSRIMQDQRSSMMQLYTGNEKWYKPWINILMWSYFYYIPFFNFSNSFNIKTADFYRILCSDLKITSVWLHNTLVFYYTWRECDMGFPIWLVVFFNLYCIQIMYRYIIPYNYYTLCDSFTIYF